MRALNIACLGISLAHHGTSHQRPSRNFWLPLFAGRDEGHRVGRRNVVSRRVVALLYPRLGQPVEPYQPRHGIILVKRPHMVTHWPDRIYPLAMRLCYFVL
jgi:hypothetical protein